MYKYLSLIMRLGATMVISILIGCLTGKYLDGQFGTSPKLFLVFLILGVLAGFWAVYRIIIKEVLS